MHTMQVMAITSKGWLTPTGLRRLERRYRKEPTIQNQSTWKSELRRSRRMSQEKSSKYWKDKISTAGNDARKVWRSVDALLGEEKVAADQSITAQMFHDFIDKKVADIRTSTASHQIQHTLPMKIQAWSRLRWSLMTIYWL